MKPIKTLLITFLLLLNTSHADDPSDTFDIMYVYTSAAKQRAGGEAKIKLLIQQSINRINQSFINSHMNIRVNLVHSEEIDYPLDIWEWRGNDIMRARFYAASSHVEGQTDGYMDDIHALRDRYSADLVQVIISNAAFGGLAPVMRNSSHSFESQAFTVIGVKYLLGSSVHELGHLMGNEHDIYTADGQDGTYSYSHGYGSPSNNFRTIMSYSKACTGVHNDTCANSGINYWSSPSQYYNGEVLGASYADARQTILNNAHILANFRQRPITASPTFTTSPPSETYANTITFEINGTPTYEIYINGIIYGTLDVDGKATINLEDLVLGVNSFNIQLKDPISGTLSQILTLNVAKKNVAPVLIPVYYLLLD